MNLSLSAMSIALPKLARHPNRLPFRGVLTVLDVPSDRAPAGARGHRVLLTRTAAEAALPSLLGMALDYTPTLDGHDARRKIGIITSADVVSGSTKRTGAMNCASATTLCRDGARPVSPGHAISHLQVTGYLFARDFPDVVRELRSQSSVLGLRSLAITPHSEERSDEEPVWLRGSLGQVAVPRPARDLTRRHDSTVHLHASTPQPTTDDRRPTTLLGMSYEIADVRVENTRADIWILTEVIFTGAAVLRRDKAAYHNTWIALES